MTKNKKMFLVLVLLLVAVLSWVLMRKRVSSPQAQKDDTHRFIESKFQLNSEQAAAMPKPGNSEDLLQLYRYRDSEDMWNVAIGEAPRQALDAKIIGVLHAAPLKGVAEVPVYSCQYSIKGKQSLSIDINAACSLSKGTPQGSKPVGYLSQQIRTGYLLLVRCRTPSQGLYLSLNARCEDPKDQFLDVLGAVRAAAN